MSVNWFPLVTVMLKGLSHSQGCHRTRDIPHHPHLCKEVEKRHTVPKNLQKERIVCDLNAELNVKWIKKGTSIIFKQTNLSWRIQSKEGFENKQNQGLICLKTCKIICVSGVPVAHPNHNYQSHQLRVSRCRLHVTVGHQWPHWTPPGETLGYV